MKDGWTAVTVDGSLSAHFEHTVAVTARRSVDTEPKIADANIGRLNIREDMAKEDSIEVQGTVLETLPMLCFASK